MEKLRNKYYKIKTRGQKCRYSNNGLHVKRLQRQWKSKPMHGKYFVNTESEIMDTDASIANRNLYLEIESFIVAM